MQNCDFMYSEGFRIQKTFLKDTVRLCTMFAHIRNSSRFTILYSWWNSRTKRMGIFVKLVFVYHLFTIYANSQQNVFSDKIKERESLWIVNNLALIWRNVRIVQKKKKKIRYYVHSTVIFYWVYIDKQRSEYSTFSFNSAIWRVHESEYHDPVRICKLRTYWADAKHNFCFCRKFFSQTHIIFTRLFSVILT